MSRIATKGIDVRILFWRNAAFFNRNQFQGSKKDLATLTAQYPGIKIRWDDSGADYAHCTALKLLLIDNTGHHEKSWFVDCGQVRRDPFVEYLLSSRTQLPSWEG